jgi:hypothetical protein
MKKRNLKRVGGMEKDHEGNKTIMKIRNWVKV